jgi:predicted GNAT family acetyltransferase
MASPSVDIRDNRDLRRVEAVLEDDDVAGYSEYKVNDDGTLVFVHTQVDERFSGEGIGSRLVAGVMDFVRENDVRIHPDCEFVAAFMREHEETHDLLAEGASLDEDDPDAEPGDKPGAE